MAGDGVPPAFFVAGGFPVTKASRQPEMSGPEFWTLEETARFLRVTQGTIRVWQRSGKIPAAAIKRPGFKWLFNSNYIRQLMDQSRGV
jgi:hypothetical protein